MKKFFSSFVFSLALSLMAPVEAHGDQVQKLTASDAAAGDSFGRSVSISGETIVVGADGKSDAGSNSGAAYIFERNQGGFDNWGEVAKITASDAASGDFFGNTVDISEDVVVVGAPLEGSTSGAAYVFERGQGGPNNWGEVKKITASDATAGDFFGNSVAISGDTIVVAAVFEGGVGSTYVFQRDQGGVGNWGEVAKVTASDAAAGDNFGFSVSVDGDTVVVGANSGGGSGAGYIFERNRGGADNWGEVIKLTASDAAAGDQFGNAVSISGDSVAIGARFNDDNGDSSGAAYIFERNQGGIDNWGETIKITASDAASEDRFGISVSADADTIVVTADLNDDDGDDSGSAYIFGRNQGGVGNWGEIEKITSIDAAAEDFFGNSAAVSGGFVVAGSIFDDDACLADPDCNSGSTYIFSDIVFSDGFESGGTGAWSSTVP